MFLWILIADLAGRGVYLSLLVVGLLLGLGYGGTILYVSQRVAFPPWHDPRPGSQVLSQWRMPEAWAAFTLDPKASLGLTFEDVSFRNRYGLELRGWWIPGARLGLERAQPDRPLVGIVCVHGGGRDRRAFMRQSALFQRRGWSVLLFDCTGHGTSDARPPFPKGRWPGRAISYGTHEWSDVVDALQYARARLEEQRTTQSGEKREIRLVLIGTSQGAVSAFYAAAYQTQRYRYGYRDVPSVDALVAENPFTSPMALFEHLSTHVAAPIMSYAANRSWLRLFLRLWIVCCTWLALFRTENTALTCRMLAKNYTPKHRLARFLFRVAATLIERVSPPERLDTPPAGGFDAVAEAVRAAECPILLMHGKKDWIVPYKHSMELFETARDPKELWISPEAGHTMMYHCEPTVFETRVCTFLEKHLFANKQRPVEYS
ncbi:hypothetical protein F1559_004789 [Cyanidiococcus yangmingshanensis]|uniref:Serine aminopeptidase S33 domain-containing protein n=1 Tax=Cyanidiococcus yangmingshanensis TaxID=2690220 RepID=A0A7J7IS52_9RHOD|nr:hypothetical protein F1559_004789 [Cyanidiococcus yangmingshanensis]